MGGRDPRAHRAGLAGGWPEAARQIAQARPLLFVRNLFDRYPAGKAAPLPRDLEMNLECLQAWWGHPLPSVSDGLIREYPLS